jgi:tetratricopeptide (TPR) repeat protein
MMLGNRYKRPITAQDSRIPPRDGIRKEENVRTVTQEFHISVTPIGVDEYLVRTEKVAPGVPLAEEQVVWPVEDWLAQARQLMNDPLKGLLQGDAVYRLPGHPPEAKEETGSPNQPLSLLNLGYQLYSSLFYGTLRDSWVTAQGIAQNRNEVLRLRIGLKGNRLPRLPWEVMHGSDREAVGVALRPLATGTEVVFSRYQPGAIFTSNSPNAWITPPKNDPIIRILMVIASPSDQQRLELHHEADHLHEELRSPLTVSESITDEVPQIELTLLEQPSREQLTQALEQGQYQVFHYAGHSNLGAAGGDLYLVNHRTGLTEYLNGDDLAGLLVNNSIRLAVFNSCRGTHTARDGAIADFDSRNNLAEALVSRGIPAVLAMAERIPDNVALNLTRLFYRNLKQGYPVDLSLSRARQGLISSYGADQLYWALPVLYLHSDFDGYLTPGDRSETNPADTLIRSPHVYELPDFSEADSLNDDANNGADVSINEPNLPDRADGVNDHSHDADDAVDDLDDLEDFDPLPSTVASLIQELSNGAEGGDSNSLTSTPSTFGNPPDGVEHDPSQANSTEWETPPPISSPDGGDEEPGQLVPVPPSEHQLSPIKLNLEQYRSPWWWLGEHPAQRRRSLLLMLSGFLGVVAIALWVGHRQSVLPVSPETPTPTIETESPSSPVDENGAVNLHTADVATLQETAISAFIRNDLETGKQAVETLLNRNELPPAEAALSTVPSDQLGDPAISFLRGRLSWQLIQAGDPDASLEDVRRFWESSVREAPDSAEYLNALATAYYAQGQTEEAAKTWLQVIRLHASSPETTVEPSEDVLPETIILPAEPVSDRQVLNAYAGLALCFEKMSADQYPEWQSLYTSKADEIQKALLMSAPDEFSPLGLRQNWLWNDAMIADWEAIDTP